MSSLNTSNPLWAGFIDLIRKIFVIEIGIYLFYNLAITGDLLP